MNMTRKTFIVTGAASGMGHATARTLVAEGANVAICDLDGELLQKVARELDPESKVVLAKAVNVTDREAIRTFIKDTRQKFGSIDGVANNAGVAGHELGTHHIWDISDQEFDFVMDVNVRGCFYVLSECLRPGVLAKGASVVHIGSMFSLQGFNKGAIYSSSKHAVLGMVRSAAKEAGDRARVNIVLP
jgi:NAD(P)-dependent dehydrogenase (short-subunit alcohol dehydrogenase family)